MSKKRANIQSSISGLSINVAPYYKLEMSVEKVEDLIKNTILLDFQFCGNQDLDKIKNYMVNDLRPNQLYLDNDNKNCKDIIGGDSNGFKSDIMPDSLLVNNTYEDPLDINEISTTVFAGQVTKMIRSPIINIYATKDNIKLQTAISGNGKSVGDDNDTNYKVMNSKRTNYVILLSNPKNLLAYKHSFMIDISKPETPKITKFDLREITQKQLDSYRSMNKTNNMVLNEDIIIDLFKKSFAYK